jgi:hypothetical protein
VEIKSRIHFLQNRVGFTQLQELLRIDRLKNSNLEFQKAPTGSASPMPRALCCIKSPADSKDVQIHQMRGRGFLAYDAGIPISGSHSIRFKKMIDWKREDHSLFG